MQTARLFRPPNESTEPLIHARKRTPALRSTIMLDKTNSKLCAPDRSPQTIVKARLPCRRLKPLEHRLRRLRTRGTHRAEFKSHQAYAKLTCRMQRYSRLPQEEEERVRTCVRRDRPKQAVALAPHNFKNTVAIPHTHPEKRIRITVKKKLKKTSSMLKRVLQKLENLGCFFACFS